MFFGILSVFVLNRVFFLDDKQPARVLYECLKLGIKNRNSVTKICAFCLQQGRGMRGRASPPHPRIYRVPPSPGERVNRLWLLKGLIKSQAEPDLRYVSYVLCEKKTILLSWVKSKIKIHTANILDDLDDTLIAGWWFCPLCDVFKRE